MKSKVRLLSIYLLLVGGVGGIDPSEIHKIQILVIRPLEKNAKYATAVSY